MTPCHGTGRDEIPDFASVSVIRVLVVDDDPAALRLIVERIREIDAPRFRVVTASGVAQALDAFEASVIDMCISDFELIGETGLDLLRAARNRGWMLPFVAVTGVMDEERLASRLLSVGFDEVLLKSQLQAFNLYRILRNAWLRNLNSTYLLERATIDELTGLLNRRGLLSRLEIELTRMTRVRLPLALLYMDLDGFKHINDTLGHVAGDRVLIRFGEILRRVARSGEHVGRMGGDEFVVIMPGTTSAMAISAELRLQYDLLESRVEYDGHAFPIRASIGTYVQNPSDPVLSMEELLARVDRKMYEAKQVRRKEATGRRIDRR